MSSPRRLVLRARRAVREWRRRRHALAELERFEAWVDTSLDSLFRNDRRIAERCALAVADRFAAATDSEDVVVTMRDVHVLVMGALEEAVTRRNGARP